jgi:hypothetical protein
MRGKGSVYQEGKPRGEFQVRRYLLLFWTLVLMTATLMGQTNQGAIAGNVLDPSGALVPNAKITA